MTDRNSNNLERPSSTGGLIQVHNDNGNINRYNILSPILINTAIQMTERSRIRHGRPLSSNRWVQVNDDKDDRNRYNIVVESGCGTLHPAVN
jgi:hypothetical protein